MKKYILKLYTINVKIYHISVTFILLLESFQDFNYAVILIVLAAAAAAAAAIIIIIIINIIIIILLLLLLLLLLRKFFTPAEAKGFPLESE